MGHTVSDSIKNKKSWDSNAITPGTPFMSLLAASLRYWVAQKLNQDPGWANVSRPSEHSPNSHIFTFRCKSSYRMPASQVKVNTKSWIGSADSEFLLGIIRILAM